MFVLTENGLRWAAVHCVKLYLDHTERNRMDGPITEAECVADTGHQVG